VYSDPANAPTDGFLKENEKKKEACSENEETSQESK
jgi:hypothetical protein